MAQPQSDPTTVYHFSPFDGTRGIITSMALWANDWRHLRAKICNNGQAKGDRLRVGTQFVDLTDAERDYLQSLKEIETPW